VNIENYKKTNWYKFICRTSTAGWCVTHCPWRWP